MFLQKYDFFDSFLFRRLEIYPFLTIRSCIFLFLLDLVKKTLYLCTTFVKSENFKLNKPINDKSC